MIQSVSASHVGFLSIENRFGQLHFVSCGSRGMKVVSLFEILSVFRRNLWIIIIATMLSCSFCFVKLNDSTLKVGYIYITEQIIKILLEQGDAFSSKFEVLQRFKFLMSGIYLASVIISNAFKSTNVYKVVMPRLPIAYETFNDLLEDNFLIYSRTSMINYD